MIYTVTLNPSVDFIRRVDNMRVGEINYSIEDRMVAGGRALMVSRILHTLNIPTTATGFVGGHAGSYIEEELDREGILHDFIRTKSNTRLNTSLFFDQVETRILGRGEEIQTSEINDLLYYLSRIREGDYLVVAGKNGVVVVGKNRRMTIKGEKKEVVDTQELIRVLSQANGATMLVYREAFFVLP